MTVAPAQSPTLLDALVTAVRKAGQVNRGVMAPPAAILWPDAERQWAPVLPQLRAALPELLVLGPYDPAQRQGPAIWLKWALAGRAEGYAPGSHTPVIYLPGISRAALRAVETCARDLQPLAELQYRGVFFSQPNAKDWTRNAFLVGKQSGQHLDVVQDRATQQAVAQALAGGVLLERPLEELQGEKLDAAFFQGLLVPRPERDMLQWLADPAGFRAQRDASRWEAFRDWAKAKLNFDPAKDAAADGRERLCQAQGAWASLWDTFAEQPHKQGGLYEQLLTVQPPAAMTMFETWETFARYPAFNAQREDELRTRLAGIAGLPPQEAREAILALENQHAVRRAWLWRRIDQAPLAVALEHLAIVASGTAEPVAGATPEAQATAYREGAWQVDMAALQAQAEARTAANRQLVEGALAACYTPWLDDSARNFQAAVQQAHGLGTRDALFDDAGAGTLTVFVDGLRYDVAERLATRLREHLPVTLRTAWTSLPSVTASGKPWASPVAKGVAGRPEHTEFQPGVAATGQDLSGANFQKLLQANHITRLEGLGLADVSGQAWVEIGNLDHYGHEFGLQLARDLPKQIDDLVENLLERLAQGWARIRIVTDHGWLLVPGAMPKVELPLHQADTRWGRCATLKPAAESTPLTFNWSWCPDVRIAMAPGIGSFKAGQVYAHGGLSLQEMLVPVLELQPVGAAKVPQAISLKLTWKRLTCQVDAGQALEGYRVDIRSKPHAPATSLADGGKPLVDGKARLLVTADVEAHPTAVVVVLNPQGEVVHKVATEIAP